MGKLASLEYIKGSKFDISLHFKMVMKAIAVIFLVVIGLDVIPAYEKEYIESYKLGLCIAAIVLVSFLLTLVVLGLMIYRYKRRFLRIREERLEYLGIQFDDEAEKDAKIQAEEMEMRAAKARGKYNIFSSLN